MSANPSRLRLPPLALYIHIPWCVKKCPYCDFNSHAAGGDLPVQDYLAALEQDLRADQWMAQGRRFSSLFFGGGTPSLFPNWAIGKIIDLAEWVVGLEPGAEVTMEANPGTLEHHNFADLLGEGVNRLSIGVQSFNPEHLKALGRIHSRDEAIRAVERAREQGFRQINLDLMHGLPGQTEEQAKADLQQAIALQPTHLSWYQLTIEPNTEFYSRPPSLPEEDTLDCIGEAGKAMLEAAGYPQYEISAYAQAANQCRHNINYWQFGDYMAIGAGAHGKITLPSEQRIFRYQKTRKPGDYLDTSKAFTSQSEDIARDNLSLEFMMNALRMNSGSDLACFEQRTGLDASAVSARLKALQARDLLILDQPTFAASPLGRRFLNSVLEAFMTD